MATRARIALELSPTEYISSYQHWDGYPGYLGYILCTWWRNPEKVKRGIEMGDASNWNFIIGEKIDFEDTKNPQMKVQNVYYHRDRHESWEDSKYLVHETEADLLEEGFECCEEYLYLMKGNLWYYADDKELRFYPLWDRAVSNYIERINKMKPQYPN